MQSYTEGVFRTSEKLLKFECGCGRKYEKKLPFVMCRGSCLEITCHECKRWLMVVVRRVIP